METISRRKPKASKPHTCYWCGLIIPKGEVYNRSLNKHDGFIYEWKNHIVCADLLSFYDWDSDGDGVSEDEFKEFISEEYSTIMSKYFNEEWESDSFKIPNFAGKRKFLIDYMNSKNLTNKEK